MTEDDVKSLNWLSYAARCQCVPSLLAALFFGQRMPIKQLYVRVRTAARWQRRDPFPLDVTKWPTLV